LKLLHFVIQAKPTFLISDIRSPGTQGWAPGCQNVGN